MNLIEISAERFKVPRPEFQVGTVTRLLEFLCNFSKKIPRDFLIQFLQKKLHYILTVIFKITLHSNCYFQHEPFERKPLLPSGRLCQSKRRGSHRDQRRQLFKMAAQWSALWLSKPLCFSSSGQP